MTKNYDHIIGNQYLVYTQAGYKQAILHWRRKYYQDDSIKWEYVKQDYCDIDYPTVYPSIVSLCGRYNGGGDDLMCNATSISSWNAFCSKIKFLLDDHAREQLISGEVNSDD